MGIPLCAPKNIKYFNYKNAKYFTHRKKEIFKENI